MHVICMETIQIPACSMKHACTYISIITCMLCCSCKLIKSEWNLGHVTCTLFMHSLYMCVYIKIFHKKLLVNIFVFLSNEYKLLTGVYCQLGNHIMQMSYVFVYISKAISYSRKIKQSNELYCFPFLIFCSLPAINIANSMALLLKRIMNFYQRKISPSLNSKSCFISLLLLFTNKAIFQLYFRHGIYI